MAQREDFVTDSGADRNSDQIRSDIDRTRADMDETFNALESKLTPGQIAEEAWGLFKGGSSAGASKILAIVKEYPLPSVVIGVGVGWLLVESSRRPESRDSRFDRGYDGYDYDSGESWKRESPGALAQARDKVKDVAGSAKEAVSNAADTVGEKAEHLKDQALDLGHQAQDKALKLKRQAKSQVRRVRTGFWETMESNPLLVGAATLALGIVAGLAIPSTDVEDEWMGETRDQIVDQAKELGQEALDKGKEMAGTVSDKVKAEAEHQGLTPQTLAGKVKNVAQEATNTVNDEVKKAVPRPAEQPVAQPTQPEMANRR
jgi:gas vesicle protein